MKDITRSVLGTARRWASPRGAAFLLLTLLTTHLARGSGVAIYLALGAVTFMSSSAMALWDNFHKYRATHDSLLSGSLVMDSADQDILTFIPRGATATASQDDAVVYFRGEGHVRLLGGGYLLNMYYTFMNPYSLYWYLRISRLLRRLEAGEDPRQIRRGERLSRILN